MRTDVKRTRMVQRHWLATFFDRHSSISHPARRSAQALLAGLALLVGVCVARPQSQEIDDITGEYEFLSADDTLAVLDEEGRLSGYVDVFQGEGESDVVFSYPITLGWRKQDRLEFKTGTIHQKYYRFSGTVGRGRGHQPGDPDYLRLVGTLEIVTVKGETGEEFSERLRVEFKALGRSREEED